MVPLVLDPPRSKKSPNDTGILPGLSLPMLFLNFRPLLHPHRPIGRLQKAATQRGDLGGWKAAPALSLPGRLAGYPGSAGEVLPQAWRNSLLTRSNSESPRTSAPDCQPWHAGQEAQLEGDGGSPWGLGFQSHQGGRQVQVVPVGQKGG